MAPREAQRKHDFFELADTAFYDDLDQLRRLRNRIHIQNVKNDFEPDDANAFTEGRKVADCRENCRTTRGGRRIEGFATWAFSFYPVGGTELAEKMKSYTEQNISAAGDFVRKLSQAKDFQDIIRIQTEYMQTQFSICAATKGLTEAFTTAATSAVKPLKS